MTKTDQMTVEATIHSDKRRNVLCWISYSLLAIAGILIPCLWSHTWNDLNPTETQGSIASGFIILGLVTWVVEYQDNLRYSLGRAALFSGVTGLLLNIANITVHSTLLVIALGNILICILLPTVLYGMFSAIVRCAKKNKFEPQTADFVRAARSFMIDFTLFFTIIHLPSIIGASRFAWRSLETILH